MNKLHKAIKKYGQANLARDLNVTQSMVTQVLYYDKNFGKKNAVKASLILNVPLTVAMGLE